MTSAKFDYTKLSTEKQARLLAIRQELKAREDAEKRLKGEVVRSRYIPHEPHPAQKVFLGLTCKEALYGGAAGGGKSDALLMAALQYAEVPGYSAIIFRRTFQDLSLPGALIPRSHEWLGNTDARWDGTTHSWRFPSGATLAFGYLDSPLDKYRYQGAEFQAIFFDELTQLEEDKYKYLFSRLRTTSAVNVPLRVRAATNPGGIGHRWVKHRFIDPRTKAPDAAYVPAKLSDNPSLREDYRESLMYLDEVTRERYLNGDWTIIEDNRFVYSEFDAATHMREPKSLDRSFFSDVVCGVDPGTRDAFAVVVLGCTRDGVWWILDEFYRTGGNPSRFRSEFLALQSTWQPRKWYVDKRRPSDIMDLIDMKLPATANIDIHGENARDTIRPMIGLVSDLLHTGRLFVRSRCEHTMSEFEGYMYREAEDRNAGEVPIDKDNHAMDAMRYGLCSAAVENGDYNPKYRTSRVVRSDVARPPHVPTLHESTHAADEAEVTRLLGRGGNDSDSPELKKGSLW